MAVLLLALLPRPTTGVPAGSVTLKLTTGGLAIVTLVIVTCGAKAAQAAALASVAGAALLATRIRLPPPGPTGPGGPAGPVGPPAPGAPVGPAGPESLPPPQPARPRVNKTAANEPSQRWLFFLTMNALLTSVARRTVVAAPRPLRAWRRDLPRVRQQRDWWASIYVQAQIGT